MAYYLTNMINIINLIERSRRDHPAAVAAKADRAGPGRVRGTRVHARRLGTRVDEDDHEQDGKDQ